MSTWIRFSSEFAPGGLIDESSATERQLAWMPSTNDANEGALGAYRVAMRGKPSLTLHQFNAMAMYRRNDTQDFMDAVFTFDDHLVIMREAQKLDASGLEAKMRKASVEFRVRVAAMKKQKEIAKQQKQADGLRKLLQVKLINCVADIYSKQWNLTIPKIHEQLDVLRLRGVPDIKANSHCSRKIDKQLALEEAFKCYQKEPSRYPLPEECSDKDSKGGPDIVEDWEAEEEIEMEE